MIIIIITVISVLEIILIIISILEIVIDLTETSSGSRWHGAKKSGSGVLFMSRFIGVDWVKCTVRKT